MTEAEWLTTDSFWPLWNAVAESAVGVVPERVKRRIGVFACRRVEHLLTDPASVAMLAACERYVEGRLSVTELATADAAAFAVVARDRQADSPTPAHLAAQAAAWLGPDDSKMGRAVEFSTETFGLGRLLASGHDPADLGAFWDHPEFVAGREDEERRLMAPVA